MHSPHVTFGPLNTASMADIICAPGGSEFRRAGFTRSSLGPGTENIVGGRSHLAVSGLAGSIAYLDGATVGHIELMPLASAPVTVAGPGLWMILCLHVLVPADPAAEGEVEAGLIERAAELAQSKAAGGLAVIAWEHETHWPRQTYESHAFREVSASRVAGMMRYLMWRPFTAGAVPPRFTQTQSPAPVPPESSADFVVEYSSLCPFSLHARNRAVTTIKTYRPDAAVSLRDGGYNLLLVEGEVARIGYKGRWWSHQELTEVLSPS